MQGSHSFKWNDCHKFKNLRGLTDELPYSNLEGLESRGFMNLIKDTVLNNNNLTPTEFYLSQNYPNPFSERTTIKFCVAYKTKVKLEVFNADGEMIKTLLDEEKEAGTYEVEFNPE